MILESEIRKHLAAVAQNELALFDFADWVDSHSSNMHRDSSPEAVRLVSSIDRLFAEYDHRDWSESELRHELLALLSQIVVVSQPIDVSNDAQRPRPYSANSARWVRPAFRLVEA